MTEASSDRARQRAEVIMKVNSGMINATEGSEQLQVSRKTYYEWEKRGLFGMLESLTDGEPGRPQNAVDPQKEAMAQRILELEQDLAVAKQSVEVRRILDLYQQQQKRLQNGSSPTGKKNRKSGKR